MKTTFTFVLMTLMLAAAVYAQQPDCQQFHNGKFKQEVDGVFIGTITRKGNRQVENYGTGKVILDVKWISDCEYQLKPIGGDKEFRKRFEGLKLEYVSVKITRTEPNGYYLDASSPGAKKHALIDRHFVRAK